MKNRIKEKIALTEKGLENNPEGAARLGAVCTFDAKEHSTLQNLKSLALMEGRLTPDEAQSIYALAGETPSVLNGQSIAARIVLTSYLGQLLQQGCSR